MPTPRSRLSKEPEEMFRTEAKPAPTNDPNVDPKLFIDMKRANRVPSIPGGQSCPDKIKNGINLKFPSKQVKNNKFKVILRKSTFSGLGVYVGALNQRCCVLLKE